MTASALPTSVDAMLELLTSRGYLAERSLATVTYLSLRMGRPLFLEGEAGVGKTEIAKVLSAALGRKLIRLQCYEGLDVASAVYEWNSAAQMIAIRLAEAAGDTDRDQLSQRHLRRALSDQAAAAAGAGAGCGRRAGAADRRTRPRRRGVRGVICWKSSPTSRSTIPELGTVKAPQPPIVIITSNRTREIHDALKRRCLYHWVDYPDCRARARDRQIARARHFRETVAAGRQLRAGAARAGFLQIARASPRPSTGPPRCTELDARSLTPQVVGDTLGALLKYQDDIARMQGDTLQKVLKEATSEN